MFHIESNGTYCSNITSHKIRGSSFCRFEYSIRKNNHENSLQKFQINVFCPNGAQPWTPRLWSPRTRAFERRSWRYPLPPPSPPPPAPFSFALAVCASAAAALALTVALITLGARAGGRRLASGFVNRLRPLGVRGNGLL